MRIRVKELSKPGPIWKKSGKSVIDSLNLCFKMLTHDFGVRGLIHVVKKVLLSEVILRLKEMVELSNGLLTFEGVLLFI